jgi:hypothetical protein
MFSISPTMLMIATIIMLGIAYSTCHQSTCRSRAGEGSDRLSAAANWGSCPRLLAASRLVPVIHRAA